MSVQTKNQFQNTLNVPIIAEQRSALSMAANMEGMTAEEFAERVLAIAIQAKRIYDDPRGDDR